MPSSCGVVVLVLDDVLLCHALLLACGFYPYKFRLLRLNRVKSTMTRVRPDNTSWVVAVTKN